jgi:hypothetical protein
MCIATIDEMGQQLNCCSALAACVGQVVCRITVKANVDWTWASLSDGARAGHAAE